MSAWSTVARFGVENHVRNAYAVPMRTLRHAFACRRIEDGVGSRRRIDSPHMVR
jgi:hypothetical protein